MKPPSQPDPDTVNWQVVKPLSTGVTGDYCLAGHRYVTRQINTTLTRAISSKLKKMKISHVCD